MGANAMAARILVVDDEETMGRVMRRVLFGYEVAFVRSAREGLARIEQGEAFGAVICDVDMPEMGGVAFAARLAVVAPELANRILFLTRDREAAGTLSGRPVQTVPFETNVFRSRLEQVIAGPPTRRSQEQDDDASLAASFSKRPTARPVPGGEPHEGD